MSFSVWKNTTIPSCSLIKKLLDQQATQLQTLDLLEMIVTEEFQNRKQNTIRRHLKQARLSDPIAHLNELDYAPDHQLSAQVIEQLATNQYI